MAWAIMRSYISYFRCLPFLAEGALVNSTLHFMIVLKIFLVLVDAVLNILSINWICWGKIFSNGLKFDWSVWKYQSVSIDIVTNFKFFLFWHVNNLQNLSVLLIRTVSFHRYCYFSFLYDVHPIMASTWNKLLVWSKNPLLKPLSNLSLHVFGPMTNEKDTRLNNIQGVLKIDFWI